MKYFTMNELTASATAKRYGIPNLPTWREAENLRLLVDNVLDPLREAWGKPIIVTSGFRSRMLNNIVGGASNSQHTTGMAADIRTLSDLPSENEKLFDLAQELDLPFDQLIDEYKYNWVHISYSRYSMRKQVLHLG